MAALFSPATIDFLWALRFNNNREWFQEHKPTYEEHLLQPIRALASAVYDAFTDAHPDLGLNLHISRIYRDARRLYGRGPLKDYLWFTIEQPSADHQARPGFYFTISMYPKLFEASGISIDQLLTKLIDYAIEAGK